MTVEATNPGAVGPAPAGVELNGVNVIPESERHGRPAQLFWPWFGSNVSILGLGYGAFALYQGVSFWQALIAGVLGIVASFVLCGLVAVAGKRGSAPTLVLSRAPFGVNGNRLPAVLSWVLTVGWETVLVILATLATAHVFDRLGWGGGDATKVVALVVVALLTVAAGVFGFRVIMRAQVWITVITGVLTVAYIIAAAGHIHWDKVSAIHSGSGQHFLGTLVLFMTGFGLGWVNAAADYSRYLPRRASGRGVVFWTAFGGAIAPIVLLVFGLLLAGSSEKLLNAIGADPIGALADLLPKGFLVVFIVVAVLGLIGGSVLDIYSSGLSLLAAGVRIPRWAAALVDGIVMIVGTVYGVFVADNFIGPFQGFLITLGVPIAGWCGIFLGDLLLRRRDYAARDLFDSRGRYGSVRLLPLGLLVAGTALGWGLVYNGGYASWLKWQGYLLDPFGLGGKTGSWSGAGLGVLVALIIGFAGTLLGDGGRVRRQESLPVTEAEAAEAQRA
jgi:purine-cytosine permease-like protein